MGILVVQNKLRFIAFLQLCGVLLNMILTEYIDAGASWMHAVHLLVQPVVFIATLYDSKKLYNMVFALSSLAFAVDVMVASVNGIIIMRCFNDINATCVQRVGASTLWLAIALLHCIFSFFGTTSTLRASQINESHRIHENSRIRTVCWFLFAQESAYTILTKPTGLQLMTLAHPLVNFLGVWISYRTTPGTFGIYYMFGILSAVMLALDIFCLQQVFGGDTFEDDLSVLFYSVYIFTDILQMLFSASHVQQSKSKSQ